MRPSKMIMATNVITILLDLSRFIILSLKDDRKCK